MDYVILNDLHIGVKRAAGTTPASRAMLKRALTDFATAFINEHCRNRHLIILGDLFDDFTVDETDMIDAYRILHTFLDVSDGYLFLVAGNHDWKPRGGEMSSFHMLGEILQTQSSRVRVLTDGLAKIDDGIYAIPHMANQDVFDLELEKALGEVSNSFLLLHANCDSPFAVHSDHSLNVNRTQLDALRSQGNTLVFAHEHQRREFRGVQVLGNQYPTSIADCLGNHNKYGWGIAGNQMLPIVTWSRAGNYLDVDWRDLADANLDTPFIRVGGSATSGEAEAVIETISRTRRASSAFVIANAVRIDGVAELDELSEMSCETIRSFDVLAALLEELDDREQKVVKGLLA